MPRIAVFALFMLLAAPAFAGASGRVVGPDGQPVPGATVCESIPGSPDRCVTVNADGAYRIDNPLRGTLLVRASGFIARVVDAAPLVEPVKLERAATLLVTVVDAATGAPIPSGRVKLDSPSGRRIGDSVPFNKAGVRVSTLDPGTVFVRAEAEGYKPGGPVSVDLVSGVERSVTVPLTKVKPPPR